MKTSVEQLVEQSRLVRENESLMLWGGGNNIAGPFNVGTGIETSINQLAALLGLQPTHGPATAGSGLRKTEARFENG